MNVPDDTVTSADELAPQLAVNHVAALVGPDAAALHACAAVGEADRLRSEPDRWPLCPGEQHRPCQFEDGRAIIRTQAQRPARACCSPRALERVPFAGGESLRGGTTRLAARGREQEKRRTSAIDTRATVTDVVEKSLPLPSNRTTMLLLHWLSGRLNCRRISLFLYAPPRSPSSISFSNACAMAST